MEDLLPLEAAPLGLGVVLRERGFERLTAIQSAVLAPALKNQDLRISSQTGSGKTVALGFVLAEAVAAAAAAEKPPERSRDPKARPAALVIAPTRELASQLGRELGWLYESLNAPVVVVTGGAPPEEERRRLGRHPIVVVGTPGRLLDHLRRSNIVLTQLGALVLDEADEMLDMGFEEDLDAILAFAPAERRTHLVSATFGGHVRAMADRVQTAPKRVQGAAPGEANADIDHAVVWVSPRERGDATVNFLLRHPDDKTLVFVRTRVDAQELARSLGESGFSVRALSGDMSHEDRTRTFADFRSGLIRVLVATDVAARGLDVDDIARVIQVDLPENGDVLTHRSGRTGRAGRRGQNVLFVPDAAGRRLDRIIHQARVQAREVQIPTPREILTAADDRLRRAMVDDSGSDDPRMRELAKHMLAERSAEEVVAWLLARSSHTGPCAPRELNARHSRAAGAAHARPSAAHERPITDRARSTSAHERPSADRARSTSAHERPSAAHARSAAAHERPNVTHDDGPARPAGRGRARSGDAPEAFVLYQVSWGAVHGADPRRLLAVACRRGEITRHEVGIIEVGERSSKIQVATSVAETFERAVEKPDPRDPRVHFRRYEERRAPLARPERAASADGRESPKARPTRALPKAAPARPARPSR